MTIINTSIIGNKAKTFLYFLIFLSFLLSMRFWLGWEGREGPLSKVLGLLMLLTMLIKHIQFNFSKINIITFLLLVIAHFFYGFEPTIYAPFHFLTYFIIICLNDIDKIRCLHFITKWFGFLMIPSLIIYVLTLFWDLPHLGFQDATIDDDWALATGYGHCKNYIFYMQSTFYEGRFNGPFLEPGHLGMMSAFLLLANQFDFKRKGMYPILITLLFTLSLAGYALLFIGFMLYIYYRNKITIKHLIFYLFTFFTIYLIGKYYNGGDNIFYENILSRLEIDEEKGFTGNNRVFGLIDIYYTALWKDLELLLWGYPKETMEWLIEDNNSGGTGFVMSMCFYGLVGTILSALFYLVYALMNKYKKYAVLCFIFVLFLLWQRSYPFWTSWIICFIYAITNENYRLKQIQVSLTKQKTRT